MSALEDLRSVLPDVAFDDLDAAEVLLTLLEVSGRLATSLSHRGFGGPEAELGRERALLAAALSLHLADLFEGMPEAPGPGALPVSPPSETVEEPEAEALPEGYDGSPFEAPAEITDGEMFPSAPAPAQRRWAESPRGEVPEGPTDDEAFWGGDRWREHLARHGVRMAEAIRAAHGFAAGLADKPKAPSNLSEINHPGVAALLRAWVEEHAPVESEAS